MSTHNPHAHGRNQRPSLRLVRPPHREHREHREHCPAERERQHRRTRDDVLTGSGKDDHVEQNRQDQPGHERADHDQTETTLAANTGARNGDRLDPRRGHRIPGLRC
jgi:hypothetical protein